MAARGALLILGAGGHGRVCADVAEACGYGPIAFVDPAYPGRVAHARWPIVAASLAEALALGDRAAAAVFAGIGGNAEARLAALGEAEALGLALPALAHPTAFVASDAALAEGVLVAPQAAVMTGARLGRGAIVNTGATVDHDCEIGEGVHVAPGAHLSGAVRVGRGAWIGVGASVRQGVSIGEGSVVGAGAAVVADVPAGVVTVGVPAKARGPSRR